MQNFYDAITGGQDQPESVSLLVKRALSMIETYYSQGITLEELAELFVGKNRNLRPRAFQQKFSRQEFTKRS